MHLRGLSLDNLKELENQGISVFKYDRAKLEEKILHIGVGNFHRAHQALIFDFANRNGSDLGIVGVNLIPDLTLETALRTQNFLFSVTELDKNSEETSVIGSLVSVTSNIENFKFPVGLKAVTVTITQEGYWFDPELGRLNWQIMPAKNIYALLAKLLISLPQRVAVISCDNLSKNSDKLRSGLLEFLERTDPNLLPLVDDKFVFCCSVVDRITPKTDHSLVAKYLEPKGLNDLAPVFCEKYLSWIVEKKVEEFLPSIQDIPGVQIVEDLSVYESFKLTILNLNHFSIALFGIAQNIQFIHEVLEIPLLRYQIEKQIFYEIIPSLGRQYTSKAIRFAFETLNRFS
ncbi:MAG: hypothetical protein NZO16_08025, partial [Deltaproteobacteria bacterium]|nr:hypothetical protein [Deltaproteobacteria bacterium]